VAPNGDANHYLFWDAIHPTAAGHAILAENAYRSIPEPAMGCLLTSGMLLCKLAQRRQRRRGGEYLPSSVRHRGGRGGNVYVAGQTSNNAFKITPPDCNGNGVTDNNDVSSGFSEDLNGNGRPDECEDPQVLVHARISRALQDLEAAAGVAVTPADIRFTRDARPIPAFVGVTVPVPPHLPQDPVVRALDFLIRHRKLYDLEDPRTTLYLERLRRDEFDTTVHFGQRRGDIPVHAAQLAVHLDDNLSHITWTHGYYLPNVPELLAPLLSKTDAEAIALAELAFPGAQVIGDSKLMYFNGGLFDGTHVHTHLAWRVVALGENSLWEYFIDAHSGLIVSTLELVKLDSPDKDFDLNTANLRTSNNCFDGLDPLPPWDE
jgi:hypothetical protein